MAIPTCDRIDCRQPVSEYRYAGTTRLCVPCFERHIPARKPVTHQLICASVYHPGACGCIPPVTLVHGGAVSRFWTVRDAMAYASVREGRDLTWHHDVLSPRARYLIDMPSPTSRGNLLAFAAS